MTSSVYSRAAGYYLKLGWWPVPVHGKTIPVKGATGLKGTVTVEKVARWIERNPSVAVSHEDGPDTIEVASNITLRHDGTLAVDVDEYGVVKQDGAELEKHGPTELAAFAEKHGLGPLPATWSSTARGPQSGSRQYLYRLGEPDVRLRTKPCPSVEICYRGHRHTVVAPTVHPKLGVPYAWYEPGAPGVPPTWGALAKRAPAPTELPLLPADWLDAIRAGALNADENATVVGLDELLDTFLPGPPDELIRYLINKWSDPDVHVGHDEMRSHGINILMLGREGHPGVRELWEVFHDRYAEYVSEVRPEEADRQLTGDTGIVATVVRVAQQKPVIRRATGPDTLVNRMPTPEEFMRGVEMAAPAPQQAAQPAGAEPADDETWQAFLDTFTADRSERAADRRVGWLRDDLARYPGNRYQVFTQHAVKAFLDVINGRYSAKRAVNMLAEVAPPEVGEHTETALRACLTAALSTAEGA